MVTAKYSTVLDHPLGAVWSMVRDFNNYPAYIEGVSENVIEDGKAGDEVGAIRRFCYLGTWVRQRLAQHSDPQHLLTYAGIEPLPFFGEVAEPPSPVRYEGTIRLAEISDGGRTFIEWWVDLDTAPGDEAVWQETFTGWIPEWTASLKRTLAGQRIS